MKISKIVLPIVLVVALCISWLSFVTGTINEQNAYHKCLENAQASFDQGLYEQAVEFYKDSLAYKNVQSTYEKIKECYDVLYAEEHISFIRNCYIEDMIVAATEFPKVAEFWTSQIELHMEALNYAKAYKTAKQALQRGAKSDKLTELHKTLLYMVEVDYSYYSGFKTALNGYISVYDGSNWRVIDERGEDLTSNYGLIGLINDDGKGVYVTKNGLRLLDIHEISRARFEVSVEDAGYYDENSDLVPVKINGVWKYMNTAGEFLPGEFDVAGSYYCKKAVAYSEGKWIEIDETGNATALNGFENIKLDMYGCHIQNDIIIAKNGGKYHLYDTSFNMVGDFAADDMDICIDPERIAYQKDGKWGFVNSKGEVVSEPQYAGAKSFANGYAAVCNEEGRWGFINKDFELVIDYQYLDAYYFTQAETCLVSTIADTFQILSFMFS